MKQLEQPARIEDDLMLRAGEGALRSRTVARLTGASPSQLGYWHRTKLVQATVAGGRPGRPRLYSWTDFRKVRASVKLIRHGLPNRALRIVMPEIERQLGTRLDGVLSERKSQLAHERRLETNSDFLSQVIEEVISEDPLGELDLYGDVVSMNPAILGGRPTVKGTRLETQFIAALYERGNSPFEIAEMYRLNVEQVSRILEFEAPGQP